jgi:hypothetical protein
MDFFLTTLALSLSLHWLQTQAQRRRMALLASYLQPHGLEKLMEALSQGYLRALDETDALRRDTQWQLLEGNEQRLCEQFRRFAQAFAEVPAEYAHISRLPWPLSALSQGLAPRLPALPRWGFDLRALLQLHAQALQAAADNADELSSQAKAYRLSAELFLMQHSCHWFCKNRTVASARLLARHQTSYAKVLDSVAPSTRQAYAALIGA